MARNGTIVALADSVLVVEAGDRGGTLNAGRQGLAIGRRVAAINFSEATPGGSTILISEGAEAVHTPAEFERFIDGRQTNGRPLAVKQASMF